MTVASIQDLRISLRRQDGVLHAIRGVSLDIEPGEIVALVGESGSGKSMLSQAVLGFLPTAKDVQVSGRVTVAGVDMLSAPESERRAVRRQLLGAVFQDPLMSLNPSMPIGRQLTERGIRHEVAVQHMLEAGVNSAERRSGQFPHELSGGLRQRVMIAMARGGSGALRQRKTEEAPGAPRLIVADEPTTALDTSVQAQILLLFDRLRRDHGTAILFVTHDLAVAASIADRIAILYAGRLCELGSTADVLGQPRHPYAAALLAANRELRGDGRGTALSDRLLDPVNLPVGCAFAPRCPRRTVECDERPPDLVPLENVTNHQIACLHPLGLDEARQIATTDPIRQTLTPSMSTPALELKNVSKTFSSRGDQIRAVDGVTLTVPEGGCVGLVGESGSGKSTILRLAAGLIRPDQGDVHWSGLRPQLVYQDAGASLTPWMSIGEQIEERLALRNVARSSRRSLTAEYLDRVHLDAKVARARPRELSGGQRQRAAIARALSSEPRVLLCDEPVSALDATLTVRILRLLDEIRTSLNMALLVVTHDLDAARAIAQSTYVLYHGRVVELAPTARVFDHPRHPYTQGLLAASPGASDGQLAPTLEGEPPNPFERLTGCAFASRCPIAIDRCRVESPALRVLDDQTQAACHLA